MEKHPPFKNSAMHLLGHNLLLAFFALISFLDLAWGQCNWLLFLKKMPYCGQTVKVSVSVSVYLLARKNNAQSLHKGENIIGDIFLVRKFK